MTDKLPDIHTGGLTGSLPEGLQSDSMQKTEGPLPDIAA